MQKPSYFRELLVTPTANYSRKNAIIFIGLTFSRISNAFLSFVLEKGMKRIAKVEKENARVKEKGRKMMSALTSFV